MTATGDGVRFVVPRYGVDVVGGAETAVRLLATSLAGRGWATEVYTTTAFDEEGWQPRFAAGTTAEDGVTVHRFPLRSGRRVLPFRVLSRATAASPPRLRPERLLTVAQGPYSPALIRALSTAPALPTLFSPYLYHPALFGVAAAPHPRILIPAAHDEPALRLGLVRRMLRAVDALWFHSPEEAALVAAVHPFATAISSEVGVVAVEAPRRLDPAGFRARRAIPGPYLLHGGRSRGGKGLSLLLDGFRELRRTRPGITLVLSGEAGHQPSEPGVLGVGDLPAAERWDAMAGAAAVVVPGRLESLSLLALEAWACGTPCLLNTASPVLVGHLERGGGGLGFATAGELAAQGARLVDDPSLGQALGAAGRAYVDRTYSWDLSEQRLRRLVVASR